MFYTFAPAMARHCVKLKIYGGVVEWLITAVLKTAEPERVPGVRIPAPPLRTFKPIFQCPFVSNGDCSSVG